LPPWLPSGNSSSSRLATIMADGINSRSYLATSPGKSSRHFLFHVLRIMFQPKSEK
jgi:hypothetical protein